MKLNLLKHSAMVVATLGIGCTALLASAAEIRVLNWKGYGTDETWAVAAFKEKTGDTVVHDYFNSEQEMLTKLRTNPGVYDVIMINSAFTIQAKNEGLIQEINPKGMANIADIGPSMMSNQQLAPKGKIYGVPWVWGLTSFAINTNKVKPQPTSLEIFWDPKFKGKVGWRDDALESVQFAALATGQSINNIQDLDLVKAKLKTLLPQIRTFWSSENDWNQFMAAGDFDVATYWSGSASRSITKGLPIAFIVPKEGAIGWLDGLSIGANSKNVEAAKTFIDYMIDPQFYGRWALGGAPASANIKAAASLPKNSFNRSVLGSPKILEKIEFMAPVSAEQRKTYLSLWQELKATVQ